jgi:hypothetical protein
MRDGKMEKPILFNTEMVQAILDNRKTQTRRVLKPDGKYRLDVVCPPDGSDMKSPYKPGDKLWVRETWGSVRLFRDRELGVVDDWVECTPDQARQERNIYSPSCVIAYKAGSGWDEDFGARGFHWKPSIHMPKWQSRIWLEVIGVRVERVQDISEEDAKAEGCVCRSWESVEHDKQWNAKEYHANVFSGLWDSVNAKRGFGWDENPWVWVYKFKKVTND